MLFGLYLLLAGAERFLAEFLRVNPTLALDLTVAQWISLALVLVGSMIVVGVRRRSPGKAAPAP